MDKERIHINKVGSIHSLNWPEPIRDQSRLWGHVTSDLWWDCQPGADMTTSWTDARYVLARLKHKHTLLTLCQSVWGERGQRAGWVEEAREQVEAAWKKQKKTDKYANSSAYTWTFHQILNHANNLKWIHSRGRWGHKMRHVDAQTRVFIRVLMPPKATSSALDITRLPKSLRHSQWWLRYQ